MDRKKLLIILGSAASFFLVCAIVVFVLGVALNTTAILKVILILMAVFCLALALELAYLLYGSLDTKPNYFLYDARTKRNVAVEQLSFSVVNSRMNRYLLGYASSEGKLWNDRILDNPYLDITPLFKPLVAYKMLYSLADKDVEAGWRCLENSSEDTMKYICDGIGMAGDGKLAQTIADMTAHRPMDIANVRSYLVANKKYMQNRMIKYVTENIDSFN